MQGFTFFMNLVSILSVSDDSKRLCSFACSFLILRFVSELTTSQQKWICVLMECEQKNVSYIRASFYTYFILDEWEK